MEEKKIASKKQNNIKVKPYVRKGKRVKGYTRKKRKLSGQRRYSKQRYEVTKVYDPKTGMIIGTRWKKLKNGSKV